MLYQLRHYCVLKWLKMFQQKHITLILCSGISIRSHQKIFRGQLWFLVFCLKLNLFVDALILINLTQIEGGNLSQNQTEPFLPNNHWDDHV